MNIVKCPKCKTKFTVGIQADTNTQKIRCIKCKNVFYYSEDTVSNYDVTSDTKVLSK